MSGLWTVDCVVIMIIVNINVSPIVRSERVGHLCSVSAHLQCQAGPVTDWPGLTADCSVVSRHYTG